MQLTLRAFDPCRGGRAAEANGVPAGERAGGSNAASPAPTSTATSLPELVQIPENVPGYVGGGDESRAGLASADCDAQDEFPQSDFIVMTFVNHTAWTLYLASTNAHCGAWPSFVDFSQNGAPVELYMGDCAPNCSRTPTTSCRVMRSRRARDQRPVRHHAQPAVWKLRAASDRVP